MKIALLKIKTIHMIKKLHVRKYANSKISIKFKKKILLAYQRPIIEFSRINEGMYLVLFKRESANELSFKIKYNVTYV